MKMEMKMKMLMLMLKNNRSTPFRESCRFENEEKYACSRQRPVNEKISSDGLSCTLNHTLQKINIHPQQIPRFF